MSAGHCLPDKEVVMEVVTLLIAVVALVVAVAAYMRTGGMQDIRQSTGTARDRTADLLDRLEGIVRASEEKPSEKS
jgi:hypothetical protein